jgi:hypothetical protein
MVRNVEDHNTILLKVTNDNQAANQLFMTFQSQNLVLG